MKKFTFALAAVAVLGVMAVAPAFAHQAHASSVAKLQVRKGSLGRFIVDGRSMTLYMFEKDKGGKSSCYGACAKVWAPLLTSGKASAGAGVSKSKIGTTKRKDGKLQVTYGGHPLYHYDDDKKPGQTKGQGENLFGAVWYVVAPNGSVVF